MTHSVAADDHDAGRTSLDSVGSYTARSRRRRYWRKAGVDTPASQCRRHVLGDECGPSPTGPWVDQERDVSARDRGQLLVQTRRCRVQG